MELIFFNHLLKTCNILSTKLSSYFRVILDFHNEYAFSDEVVHLLKDTQPLSGRSKYEHKHSGSGVDTLR